MHHPLVWALIISCKQCATCLVEFFFSLNGLLHSFLQMLVFLVHTGLRNCVQQMSKGGNLINSCRTTFQKYMYLVFHSPKWTQGEGLHINMCAMSLEENA